jgi:hypothetical protein
VKHSAETAFAVCPFSSLSSLSLLFSASVATVVVAEKEEDEEEEEDCTLPAS